MTQVKQATSEAKAPMRTCPHCKEDTIGNWAKLWSVTVNPVQCPSCRQFSFLHAAHALKGLVFWIVVSWIFIGLSWFSQQVFLLIGTLPALFLAINYFMLDAPMEAILPPDQR